MNTPENTRHYTVSYYNVRAGEETTSTERAASAEQAIAAASKKRGDFRFGFNFTRKNQGDEKRAIRDNAHAQCDVNGYRGYAACRFGLEREYAE